ncbi:hypothetical protein NMG60_11021845 [Bertholletia excelsa]
MCHSCFPVTVARSLMAAATRPPSTVVVEGDGGGGRLKQCVCSPTRHPGSFRCRHHRSEYVWGGRHLVLRAAARGD